MITIKTPEEIAHLRTGGARLSQILHSLAALVKPGVTTAELNEAAERLVRAGGDEPSFLDYQPAGAPTPYPAALCTSVNEVIVHGLPAIGQVLQAGDIVGLDLGLCHAGLFTDMALTVPVGEIKPELDALLKTTQEALAAGIKAARVGNTVGDIGYAVSAVARQAGFGVVRELSGHGVGRAVHEEPHVPNYGKRGVGPKLRPGMVVAIEPMLTLGSEAVLFDEDGYTTRTADGLPAAHFEKTVLITDGAAEILTP